MYIYILFFDQVRQNDPELLAGWRLSRSLYTLRVSFFISFARAGFVFLTRCCYWCWRRRLLNVLYFVRCTKRGIKDIEFRDLVDGQVKYYVFGQTSLSSLEFLCIHIVWEMVDNHYTRVMMNDIQGRGMLIQLSLNVWKITPSLWIIDLL